MTISAGRRRAAFAPIVVAASIALYVPFAPVRLYDFRAFYCAGQAARAHADPYREHPLHDCERSAFAPGMPRTGTDVTVPAPLPGYAIGFFSLLTRLPFALCALFWILASAGAVLVAARLLASAIEVSPAATLVVVGLPAAVVAIPLGQVAPFVVLGIAVCALGLRTSRLAPTVLGALLTALDPPVALAVCSALVIAVPAARAWLVVGTVALIGISLLTLGLPANVEYFTTVLHAHALANVVDRTQFSATHFAWAAGMSRSGAVVLGSSWYAIAAAFGIWLALRLRERFGSVALAVVPPAFAVFGGLYVHYAQLALALPACLLLISRATNDARGKSALCAGVFVLAIPWLSLSAFPIFAPAAAVAAGVFCRGLGHDAIARRLGAACALGLVVFFALAAVTLTQPAVTHGVAAAGNPLAEASWQNYLGARDARPQPLVLFFQLPTVAAFALCVWALARAALGRPVKSSS